MNLKNLSSTSLFRLDAIGALLTAFMHGFVLTKFEDLLGVPKITLITLGIIALIYAVYSTLCYFTKPTNWKKYLRIIALFNLLFCALTLAVLFFYRDSITMLSLVYFLGEICIIIFIANLELKAVKRA